MCNFWGFDFYFGFFFYFSRFPLNRIIPGVDGIHAPRPVSHIYLYIVVLISGGTGIKYFWTDDRTTVTVIRVKTHARSAARAFDRKHRYDDIRSSTGVGDGGLVGGDGVGAGMGMYVGDGWLRVADGGGG